MESKNNMLLIRQLRGGSFFTVHTCLYQASTVLLQGASSSEKLQMDDNKEDMADNSSVQHGATTKAPGRFRPKLFGGAFFKSPHKALHLRCDLIGNLTSSAFASPVWNLPTQTLMQTVPKRCWGAFPEVAYHLSFA